MRESWNRPYEMNPYLEALGTLFRSFREALLHSFPRHDRLNHGKLSLQALFLPWGWGDAEGRRVGRKVPAL